MGLDDQRKEVEALNKEIKRLYREMGRAEMPPIFKYQDINQAKDAIVGLKAQIGEVRSELDFISRSLRDSLSELSKRNTELSKTKSSLSGISRISQQLRIEAEDITNLDEKRIRSLERQARLQFDSLQIALDSGKLDKEATNEAKFALSRQTDFLKTLKQIRAEKALINKSSGVKTFGALEGITDAIPGLKKLTPAFQEASKAAQEQAAFNLKNYGTTKGITSEMVKANKLARSKRAGDLMSLKTGKGLTAAKIKELGLEKALTSSKTGRLLTGSAGAKMAKSLNLAKSLEPLSKLTKSMKPLMAGFKALGPLLKKALGPIAVLMEVLSLDKQTADIAKNTNITYKEARKVRAEMSQIANLSGNIFVSGKKLGETFLSINKTLGTSATTMDSELLVSLTEMREMAGFTNEELQGIAAITLATGKSANDVTGEFMAQAKISSWQNGVLLNEKDLVKGIGQISAATTLSLQKNPKALGEAVSTAKSLGMELSKVDGIASSLLNFESSIENELQAELLLNKDLNLEKARQYALNNDLAGVAREIAEQAGSSAEFGEMNRIQQEALAKAVGMNREELASTLFLQEQLKGLTGDAAKSAEADFQRRVEAVGLAQAQREMEEKGVDGLREQVGMADRLSASMDKINEVFIALVEPLMPVLDVFISILGIVGKIIKFLTPVLDTLSVIGNFVGDTLGGIFGGVGSFKDFDYSATTAAADRQAQSMDSEWGFENPNNPVMMATGGIVNGPTRALVGEAGPEAVIPLSSNTPAINVDMSATNALLAQLIKKTPEMAPLGMYEIQ
jgi:hypothetical protein